MRKNNIFAIGLLCFSLFFVTACSNTNSANNQDNLPSIGYVKDEQYKLYEADLASGKFDGSYEDWLIQTYKDKVQSIVSIVKTNTEGLIDTYTITFSNNSTTTFTVTNGKDGIEGIKGEKGEDGHTPIIKIGDNGNWFIDGVDSNVKATGVDGKPGVDGKSAYELYKEVHPEYTGTLEEWLNSLKGENGGAGVNGKSAYELYKEAHPEYNGTLEEWLASLKGNDGQDGQNGADGKPGADGQDGKPGVDGKSAYELYKQAHPEYTGTLEEWLESLKGTNGNPGVDGESAYEIYKKHYFEVNNVEYTKTEEEWLDDLVNDRLGTIVKHNVMFDEQGGSIVDDQEVEHLAKVSKPIDPIKEGYNFDGWYVGDEKWVFDGYNVTDDITLTAHWIIIECKLNITINDYEFIDTKFKYGDVIDISNLFDIYTSDYKITDESNNEVQDKFIIKKDMNINLNNKYMYAYYSEDDIRKVDIDELKYISNLEKPIKEGYTFKSWYGIDDDGEWHLPSNANLEDWDIVGKTIYPQFVLTSELFKYNVLDNEVYITEVTNSNTVEIPETIDDMPVVSLSIDNSNSILNIDNLIINKNIERLSICNWDSTINNIYFNGNLTEWMNLNIDIILSNSNLYLKDVESNYYLLEDLVIPNGINEIKHNAFDTIQSIKTITIPNTVKKIGKYAFEGVNVTEIDIPGSVEIIEYGAFNYCPNLQKITLNEGLKYIGDYAFSTDNSSYGIVDIPDTVEYLGVEAFYCNIKKRPLNLKECNDILYQYNYIGFINNGFEIIDKNVLNGCLIYYLPKSIKEIKIQKSYNLSIFLYEGSEEDFTKIKLEDKEQFKYSKILYNVDFNNFTECTTDKYKYIENNNNEIIIVEIINNDLEKNLINDFPNKKVIGCMADLPYNNGYYLPNTIKFIPTTNGFEYKENKVYFNGTLKEYLELARLEYPAHSNFELFLNEDGTFKKVENLIIPDGIKHIESGSLLINCKSIVLPDSIEYISDFGLYTDQIVFKLPENIEYLGYSAICSKNMKNIYIGKKLKLIKSAPFSCYNLDEIVVNKLNDRYECVNNTSLIDKRTKSLIYCKNLKDVPNDIKIFNSSCFDSCDSDEYFIFPESAKIINNIPSVNVISVPLGVERLEIYQSVTVFYEGDEDDWKNIDGYISDYAKVNIIYNNKIEKIDTVYNQDFIYQIINEQYINNINLVSNKSTIDLSKCFDNYEIINFYINDLRSPNLKKLIIPCSAKNVQLIHSSNPRYEVYLDSDEINNTWSNSWNGHHKFHLRSEWEFDSNGEPMLKSQPIQ